MDHTISRIDGLFTVTNIETGEELDSFYQNAVKEKNKDLYLNNYLLNGLDKKEYMEQPYRAYCLFIDPEIAGCEIEIRSAPLSTPYNGVIHYVKGNRPPKAID